MKSLRATCQQLLLPRGTTPSPWPLDDYGDIYASPDTVLPPRKPLHKRSYSVQIQYTEPIHPKPGSALSGTSSDCMTIRPCIRALRLPLPEQQRLVAVLRHPEPYPHVLDDLHRKCFLEDPGGDYDRDQLHETIQRLRSRSQEHLDGDICADSGVALTMTSQNATDQSPSGSASGFSGVSTPPPPLGDKTAAWRRSRSAHLEPPPVGVGVPVETRCQALMEEFREYKRRRMREEIEAVRGRPTVPALRDAGRRPLESEC